MDWWGGGFLLLTPYKISTHKGQKGKAPFTRMPAIWGDGGLDICPNQPPKIPLSYKAMGSTEGMSVAHCDGGLGLLPPHCMRLVTPGIFL